jgi:Na+/proline symporter
LNYLSTFDYVVMGLYFAVLVGLGFYLEKRASASLEDYFIGGRRLPWWALGISGMASFLDIAGTMIIVSFLFMLGPRGIFVEFRGGAVLVLPFMMLWVGKWHRRSGCMTAAEWMIFRFGDGFGGRFAQLASVLGAVVGTVGMLAYLVKGVGAFLATFLPFTPMQCALVMISVATVYTMVSGFYGVVFTDMFQSVIIMIAVIGISTTALLSIGDAGDFAEMAVRVTGNPDWISSLPRWTTPMPAGYEAYQHLILFSFFYLMRNVFGGMGAGGDPKYFGARSDRECGLLTFLWTWLMSVRWPMMMGFAVLGILLVSRFYPDPEVLVQASDLIKQHAGGVTEAQWGEVIAKVANQPQDWSPELITGLRELFGNGDDWTDRLALLSYHGTVNPERILPAVMRSYVGPGFRGLLLIALIAASMSTFDSTVNATTGLITRDLYQKYIRPRAQTRELVYVSWLFVVLSINDIWDWIIMGLGGGLLVPTFLRLYWWRFNGGGFAIGTVSGLAGAVAQRVLLPDLDATGKFLLVGAIGLVGSVVGTYLTRPTSRDVLVEFYRRTRPFGFWGSFPMLLADKTRKEMRAEHRRDLLALPFAMLWQVTLFMMPMQLIIHSYRALFVTFVLFVIGLGGLYLIWLRHLTGPEDSQAAPVDEGTAEP